MTSGDSSSEPSSAAALSAMRPYTPKGRRRGDISARWVGLWIPPFARSGRGSESPVQWGVSLLSDGG